MHVWTMIEEQVNVYILKFIVIQGTWRFSLSKLSLSWFGLVYPIVLVPFRGSVGSASLNVGSCTVMEAFIVNHAEHLQKLLSIKIWVYPHQLYSQDLVLCAFWLFLKDTMTKKGKYFKLTQDTESAPTEPLKLQTKEESRTASESAKHTGIVPKRRVAWGGLVKLCLLLYCLLTF